MHWNTETGWDKQLWTHCDRGQFHSVFSWTRGFSFAVVICFPGTSVGAADEGTQAGSEAEEGAGAALQHSAYRIQPHALWNANAGHTSSQIPAAQSHGEKVRLSKTLDDVLMIRSYQCREKCLKHESRSANSLLIKKKSFMIFDFTNVNVWL